MDKKVLFDALLIKIRDAVAQPGVLTDKLQLVCEILKGGVPYYDWVGFYIVDPKWETELYLGPYAGAPTDHTRILFGKGICGQAAARREIFVIQDVSKETNYLSCSPRVKSEIVLPIFRDGKIWGELDIDSHTIAPFTSEDSLFLSKVCKIVAGLI